MMKKVLALVLCLLIGIMVLAGCNNDNSGTKENDTTDNKSSNGMKDATITYAIWDANQEKGLRKMADEFEAKNAGIKINITVTGWNEYWTALEAGGTGGSLPDTFWIHSNEFYKYAVNDLLMNLNDKIASSEFVKMDKFPESLSKIYNLNNNQYAIPKDFDTIGLWYNKTLFDKENIEYPNDKWTWKDLYEAAKKLTKPDGSQYGILAPLHNQEGYYNFVYQNGGTIITDDKKSGYDDPKTIEAMKFYVGLVKDGFSPKEFSDAERATLMQSGKCAMGFFGSWNLTGFTQNEYMAKNFGVAVLPASNNGGKASIFNGLGNAISNTTKNPEAAWKWVEYLSSKDGQQKHAELGIAISAYEGTPDAWVNSNKTYDVKVFIDMLEYAKIRPYSNTTGIWEDKVYEQLRGAFTGDKTVEQACKDAAKIMNESLEQEK